MCKFDPENPVSATSRKCWVKSRGGTLTKQDFLIADCTGVIEVLPIKNVLEYWSLVAAISL